MVRPAWADLRELSARQAPEDNQDLRVSPERGDSQVSSDQSVPADLPDRAERVANRDSRAKPDYRVDKDNEARAVSRDPLASGDLPDRRERSVPPAYRDSGDRLDQQDSRASAVPMEVPENPALPDSPVTAVNPDPPGRLDPLDPLGRPDHRAPGDQGVPPVRRARRENWAPQAGLGGPDPLDQQDRPESAVRPASPVRLDLLDLPALWDHQENEVNRDPGATLVPRAPSAPSACPAPGDPAGPLGRRGPPESPV